MVDYPYTDDKGITHYNKDVAYKGNKIYLLKASHNKYSFYYDENGFNVCEYDAYTDSYKDMFKTEAHEIIICRPTSQEIELKYIGPVQKEENE